MRTIAASVLCVLAAACGDGSNSAAPPALTAEQAARGQTERAFWDALDAAKDTLRGGDEAAAAELFETALAQKPDHEAALYALAGIRWRQRRYADALALAERLEQVERPISRSLLLQARIRSDVDGLSPTDDDAAWFDLQQAHVDAVAAVEANPEETGAHFVVGRITLLMGEHESALAALGTALTLHPDHVEALILSAEANRRAGDLEAARAALGTALRVSQPSPGDVPEVSGDGDTRDAHVARRIERLRVLALLLRLGGHPWPADGGPEPRAVVLDGPHPPLATHVLTLRADLDDDGMDDEIAAAPATDVAALVGLFGGKGGAPTFTVHGGMGGDAADLGLAHLVACVGELRAGDADADGRPDVLVLPREHDPRCTLPALLLRPAEDGRVEWLPVRWSWEYAAPEEER